MLDCSKSGEKRMNESWWAKLGLIQTATVDLGEHAIWTPQADILLVYNVVQYRG